jgi:hypothetical protein
MWIRIRNPDSHSHVPFFALYTYNTLCYHANKTKIPGKIGRGEPTGSKHGTPSYEVNYSQTFLVKCPESRKRQNLINEYYCTSAILRSLVGIIW